MVYLKAVQLVLFPEILPPSHCISFFRSGSISGDDERRRRTTLVFVAASSKPIVVVTQHSLVCLRLHRYKDVDQSTVCVETPRFFWRLFDTPTALRNFSTESYASR